MLIKPLPRNPRGQSIIEYSLLLLIVMAGIIVMGPYLIRSWNANAKGWEDSVTDSQMEDSVISASNETDIYLHPPSTGGTPGPGPGPNPQSP